MIDVINKILKENLTLTEKLLSLKNVDSSNILHCGDIATVSVDLLMVNDVTAPLAIKAFSEIGRDKPWDAEKIAVVLSHFVPAKDINSANNANISRKFAMRYNIKYFFDETNGGIEHALLPEKGIIKPGDIVIGADSHSCTYGALACFATGVGSTDAGAVMGTGEIWLKVPESIKIKVAGKPTKYVSGKDIVLNAIGQLGFDGANYMAMEWHIEKLEELSIESRLTMTNMAIECGAKNGIMPCDDRVLTYIYERNKDYKIDPELRKLLQLNKEAVFSREIEINASELEPQVACPSLPSNVKPVSEVEGIEVDEVYIGSCTNARYEDLKTVAEILKGKKVAKNCKVYIVPATKFIEKRLYEEGIMKIFIEAGCIVSPPTCGACLGGHMGVLGDEEVCLSTTNRNFPGRMGAKTAKVYLASPAVAAATAVNGRITNPSRI